MVVATQNPFEFEGTYYLPENQLDRFLLRISVGYPDRASEHRILSLQPGRTRLEDLKPVTTAAEVVAMQDRVPQTRLDATILDYIIDLAEATRNHEQLHLGISPRGSLALTAAAQASAVLNGRDYVIPDDVKQLVIPVCAHRVISKSYLHNGDADSTGRILRTILDQVPTPR
jgi:MoxR-like ATPase